MSAVCARAVAEGVDAIAFGDLFLEDIRAYREAKLAGTGLEPLFPCWQIPTGELAREMIAAGLRAHLVCIDPRQLDKRFAGHLFDEALLNQLSATVDPCGERGEFHTFVSAGPMFARGGRSRSIEIRRGEVVERDGFVYADLLPASIPSHAFDQLSDSLR
jgi:diphthamide synthase (EF-2-diphthine--ammonia ligase)